MKLLLFRKHFINIEWLCRKLIRSLQNGQAGFLTFQACCTIQCHVLYLHLIHFLPDYLFLPTHLVVQKSTPSNYSVHINNLKDFFTLTPQTLAITTPKTSKSCYFTERLPFHPSSLCHFQVE